ncbi:hypothetical protein TELCIR_20059 [Teladorsagia circumcincta]|uniref:K Homology domain-containing protein n=1 Tax=Teladorsagia circumcincta TaxID=45464 RepID=A0A2G9TKP7_TELCI|nr:hypothetical protein TELCIR_20059 [Teladorsagia circumcincta]
MTAILHLNNVNLPGGELRRKGLEVPPSLVKPQKEYMHEIYGVGVIVGCNGIIWISPALNTDPDGGYNTDFTSELPLDKRIALVRIAACLRMLARNLISIYDVSIMSAYSASLVYKVMELAHPEISSILVPKITDMIKAEEKRRALEKDREEAARKRRAL